MKLYLLFLSMALAALCSGLYAVWYPGLEYEVIRKIFATDSLLLFTAIVGSIVHKLR